MPEENIVGIVCGTSEVLTRFNKIAIQGTPQMAVDKEAISLSRVYLNTILSVPAVILCVTRLN